MTFNHFMIDLETTSTHPEHGAIMQLAAVAFSFNDYQVEMAPVSNALFNQCLFIPEDRYWSEGTRDFWHSQPPHVLEGIFNRMRDPFHVTMDFNNWVRDLSDGSEPILWAKPSHFEFPFLQSHYTKYRLACPFHYRKVEDLNSWARALGHPNISDEVELEGDAHDAIYDALHQFAVLVELMRRRQEDRNALAA